jgi:hypothetical protein
MASSIVTRETTPPLPSLNEDTKGVVPVVRKMKKIKIDSSTISRILDVTCETCDIINNDISKNTIIANNMNDECLDINRNNICEGVRTEEENEKCGYYYRNRDKKLEYQKNYNREQGDKIKNYNKDYYQKRREEILEKAKTKIICECGCEVQLFNMNSHKKTKKHARALEQRKKEL